MISGWDIYWVMQLDSIRTGLFMLSLLLCMLAIFSPSLAMILDVDADDFIAMVKKNYRKVLAVIAIPLFAAIALPSSRTAAAIIIIPAVANDEAIQKEAGDLYQLAKDGFRQLVEPEEKPEK